MGKRSIFKRLTAHFLALCMVATSLFVTDYTEVQAEESTTVYFYNSDGYESVIAHAWMGEDNLTGDWGTTMAQESALGENWMEVSVPAAPTFYIIFADGAEGAEESRRVQVMVDDESKVYASLKGVYTSKDAAESSLNEEEEEEGGDDDPIITEETKVYFYNSDEYESVIAHAWQGNEDLTGSWGTTRAQESELGENWMEVSVPAAPTFYIIFADGAEGAAESRRVQVMVDDASKVYASLRGVYTSKTAAENSLNEEEEGGGGDPATTEGTKVYFYNSEEYETVVAHAYVNAESSITGEWGSTTAEASELGDGWVEVTVPADPEFHLIFAEAGDESGEKRVQTDITDTSNVYVSLKGKYTSKAAAEASVSDADNEFTRVWFYNIYGYESMRVHGWNDAGDLFQPQPQAARDMMDSAWYFIDVPAKAPFNIQFIDNASEEVQQGYVSGGNVYLAATDLFFSSKTAAESYMSSMKTKVYFLNYNKEGETETTPYEEVYAHAYYSDTELVDSSVSRPGFEANEASLGDDWWEAEIPVNALLRPFYLVINDGSGNELAAVKINRYKDNYILLKGDGQVYSAQDAAEIAAGISVETVVYLLNNKEWENTSVYVYGRPGEVLGKWKGQAPVSAPELGDKWQKITIPARVPFSIIYFDSDNQSERTELTLTSKYNLYVTGDGAAYGSQYEAEASCGLADPTEQLEVYFYNSRDWGDINFYTYKVIGDEKPTLGKSWPGSAAEKVPEVGEKWWKAKIPMKKDSISASNKLGILFNDGVNQMADPGCIISDASKIYVIPNNSSYATPEEAEAAAAADDYDDGCEEGANSDYENYNVSYSGAGAALPYSVYEAEAADTNGEVLEKDVTYAQNVIQSEASGRSAVKLDETGEYVEFTLTEAANALVLRYSIPDSSNGAGQNATLNCYVNGTKKQELNVTSKYSWLYGAFPYNNNVSDGKAKRFYDETRVLFDEVMPAGTKLRLQKDAENTAEYYVIDLVEMENVAAPKEQPQNSLSVTDYGAAADDGVDDRQAFEKCIRAAKEQGKEVWIPAGTFDLTEKKCFTVSGVTIRGAGMWHTNLNGAGAAFKFSGTAKFYDFAMTGVSTVRDDSNDLAAFEGNGTRSTNTTIENIWMEHVKVGVWSCNTENLIVQGCRIRNTYADGVNLCSLTHGAVVRNNHLRNTGDDCLAIWPWLGDCTNNTFSHNTIQVPTLANGIAIYGGAGNSAEYNRISDIIVNGGGICVGTEFETKKPFSGVTNVGYNELYRCGSIQCDENYPIGSIWLWSSERFQGMDAEFNVYNNFIKDSTQSGILLEVKNPMKGVTLASNTVDGAACGIHELFDKEGEGVAINNTAVNLEGDFHKDENPNFTLTITDEGADKTSLNVWIAQWEDAEQGNYTDESWQALQDALEAAKETAADEDATQTEIDAAREALETAVSGLQETEKEGLWADEIPAVTYTGQALKPSVSVYDGETLLKLNKDYSVKYKDNIKPGTASVVIQGKGNYAGNITKEFRIKAKNLGDSDITAEDLFVKAPSKKKAVKPAPVVKRDGKKLKANKDYVVVSSDTSEGAYINPGTYKVTIRAAEKSGYTGSREIQITLAAAEQVMMSKVSIQKIPDQPYTGSEIKPQITVKMGKNPLKKKDYEVTYSSNKEIGTATVTVTGKGDFVGQKTATFRIVGGKITSSMVKLSFTRAEYTGSRITPKVTVTGLEAGENYSIGYQNNTNVGTATVTVTGRHGYSGTVKKTFKITPYNIEKNSSGKFQLDSEEITAVYEKRGSRPSIEASFNGKKLVEGVDYTLAYGKNKKAGSKGTITISGKGFFTGKVKNIGFDIEKQSLKELTITAPDLAVKNAKNYARTNPVITEKDGKKLKKGTDYRIAGFTYGDDTEIKGTPKSGDVIKVTVEGIGNYQETAEVQFRIIDNNKSIAKAKITVADQIYSGKAKEPSGAEVKVTVKENKQEITLEEGVSYEIAGYEKNINKGSAKLTIRGIGEYGGTKTASFKIKAQPMSWAEFFDSTAKWFQGILEQQP